VTTEKVWDYCTEYDIPRAFVLTWMDRELSSFERSMESLESVFGRNVVALQLPIGTEKGFRGVIDLVAMKAHMYKPDGDGKPSIEEIPAALADEAKAAHEKLVEMVAEGDDELMEEFFREGTIPIEDLIPGVRKAIVAEKIFPVLMVSALRNVGTPACSPSSPTSSRIPTSIRRSASKNPRARAIASSANTTTLSHFQFLSSRRSPIPSPAASTISK